MLIKINDALLELEAMDADLARIVEMRYFAGYDDEEIAQLLGQVGAHGAAAVGKSARVFIGVDGVGGQKPGRIPYVCACGKFGAENPMNISPANWGTVSSLLDQALDLDADARESGSTDLSTRQPDLAPSIRKLLTAHARRETADVLAGLPVLPQLRAPNLTALAPGAHVGPYRLKREIGQGGMADVWLAARADGAFERDVALKTAAGHALAT